MKNFLITLISLFIPCKKKRRNVRDYLRARFNVISNRNPMMIKKYPCFPNALIKKNHRCLIVAPHPDDECIGCGGIISKYASNIDVLIINSSGVARNKKELNAEHMADIRIKEFNQCMNKAKIKNRWIFRIFGTPPMFEDIEKHFDEYLKTVDFKSYDRIFMPHISDGHKEHRYVSTCLLPRLLEKSGFKKSSLAVFYEVWSTIDDPNYFEDISSVVKNKAQLLSIYKSQGGDNYAKRILGLNQYRGLVSRYEYAEAFKIVPMTDFLDQAKKENSDFPV